MRKIIVDGKEITTNYGEKTMHNLVSGDDLPNYDLCLKNFRESNEEFFKRLISEGYTRIRFGEISTRIKGFHETIAYCRSNDE